MMQTCPICQFEMPEPASSHPTREDVRCFQCARCGRFYLTGTAVETLPGILQSDDLKQGLLSHLVRRMRQDANGPILTDDYIRRLLDDNQLPTPTEQMHNLVVWLGNHLKVAGQSITLTPDEHRSVAGAVTDKNFSWLIANLKRKGILDVGLIAGSSVGTLTFAGWELYHELTRSVSASRTAFMAMPFGNSQLNRVFVECFKPGVEDAGFQLKRLDEEPPAGSIDDRLRVEIRKAVFLIADLTGANPGAYWESGFAEGLGKHVIYTCEAKYFGDNQTHFDTNHMHTVLWEVNNLKQARARLATTIRATFPELTLNGR